jgi:hypothetical protein
VPLVVRALPLPSRTRRSPVSGYGGEYSGPRPPHGAYAVTISNGLCDHTRAMPRPIANIVPAGLCDVRYGVSNLQSHSSHAVAYGMTSEGYSGVCDDLLDLAPSGRYAKSQAKCSVWFFR